MNTKTGDIEGNFNKAKKFIEDNINTCDIIVLPETAIAGYCCGALFDNVEFIKEQEEKTYELANLIPANKCLIIGYVSFHGVKKNGLPRLKNTAMIVNDNEKYKYDKQYLAADNHQEDKRYFEAGNISKVFDIKLKTGIYRIGVPICEDIWHKDHNKDISKEMVDLGAEMIISINQSYFYYGKQKIRQKLITRFDVPFIYLNTCGIGDIVKNIVIFDGGSLIWSDNQIYELPRFEEVKVSEFQLDGNDYIGYRKIDKWTEIIDALVFEQKELFKSIGVKNAQVHLSGGIDSSIGAALVAEAMGSENCVFITNPSNLSSNSIKLAKHTAEKLGIKLWENPIQSIYDEIMKVDSESFEGELNPVGKSTIQATLRSCLGLYSTHRFKSAIVACGNHTEIVLGWANFHDIGSIGVHSIIGDLTKLELYELADKINDRFEDEVIPEVLFNGKVKPAAELPDVGNEQDPIDYYIQSGICAEMIRGNKSKNTLIKDFMNKKLNLEYFQDDIYETYSIEDFIREVEFAYNKARISVFKAAQSAPIVIISPRSRGFSNRETILNFYKG